MLPIEPICVSVNEAARLLSVSRSSIYRMIRCKELAARKIRSRTVIEVTRLRGLNGGEA
ncbi:helix-turn-helix domain-containing protein [Sphingomonas sp. 22L2VL55-3]|jgi:excisionase family DNA binding protein